MSALRLVQRDKVIATAGRRGSTELSVIEQRARELRGAYVRELMISAFNALARAPHEIARLGRRMPQLASFSK